MIEKGAKRKEDSLCVGGVCCVGKSPYSKQKIKCILSSSLLTKNALQTLRCCVSTSYSVHCVFPKAVLPWCGQSYILGMCLKPRAAGTKLSPQGPIPPPVFVFL